MNSNTSKNQLTENSYGEAANSDAHNTYSVDSIYPEETIDSLDISIGHIIDVDNIAPATANDSHIQAGIYSINSARRAKLDKSLERRANKNLLTDRRQSTRMTASGEPQQDRRMENRLANIDALRQQSSHTDS